MEIQMTCVSISFMGSGFGSFFSFGGDGTVHRMYYIQQDESYHFQESCIIFRFATALF